MSIDHGKLLALADHAAALSQRLSRMGGDSVFRAVEAREIEQGLRAIAQPAEAVEGGMRDAYEGAREDLLDWKGRAQRAEARLRSLGWVGIEANEPPTDAAQGAVARVAWRSDPDQGTYLVAEWLGPLPEPGELLFTHPQAAPAQGDGLAQMVWEMRNFADVADRCELTEGNAPDVIRLWADRLAAAPSPEPGK